MMQLSPETIEALKNLSDINPSILFQPGNIVSTKKNGIFGRAVVKETFPVEAGIYDLKKFISLVSMSPTHNIDFKSDHCVITGHQGRMMIEFAYCRRDYITVPLKNTLPESEPDATFEIPEEDYVGFTGILSTLSYPNFSMHSDGVTISLTGFDAARPDIRNTTLVLNARSNGRVYNYIFRTENFKLLRDSYKVSLLLENKRPIALFEGQKKNMAYVIATQAKET